MSHPGWTYAFIAVMFLNSTSALASPATDKAVVRRLYSEVFNAHRIEATDALLTKDYKQHNPNVPTGRAGFKAAFAKIFAADPSVHAEIKRIIAENGLVVVHAYWTDATNPRGQAVVDIFRVSGGKIVEHWDVSQDVPTSVKDPETLF